MHADTASATDTDIDSDLDLDLDIGGRVPVLPLESAVAQEATRFEAATRFGAVSLQIDGTPAAHAAAAAVLLDRCDALLDGLDAWLHSALDWRWIEATTAAVLPCASARGSLEGDEGPAAALTWRLELPWVLLRCLGKPPEALAQRLQWDAVPAVVVVSQPAIDEAELRLLERGGAVLLPESMRAPWRGLLHAANESAGHGLVVELPGADTVRLAGMTAAADDAAEPTGRPGCEVRMTTTRPLSPEQLAGWAEGSTVELAPRVSLWRCTGATESERFLAGGRLLPWGDGWAMLIESV